AVWLPRVHGRAGLRLLLPERAGRGQPLDGGVGRPGARLDPLDVAGAGQGPARAARARVIRVANAPLSYGAFELTVGIFPNVPGPEELVAEVARAGYAGIELGPPGYLGSGDELRDRLDRHELVLTGGWCPLRFSEPEHLEQDMRELVRTLELFDAAGGAP